MFATLFASLFVQGILLGLAALALLAAAPRLQKRYGPQWLCRLWVTLAVLLLVPLHALVPQAPAADRPVQVHRQLRVPLVGLPLHLPVRIGVAEDSTRLLADQIGIGFRDPGNPLRKLPSGRESALKGDRSINILFVYFK